MVKGVYGVWMGATVGSAANVVEIAVGSDGRGEVGVDSAGEVASAGNFVGVGVDAQAAERKAITNNGVSFRFIFILLL